MIRAAKPFLSGMIGGAAVTIGFLIAMHSTFAFGSWGLFVLEILWAAVFVAGGLSFLFTVLELR